MGATPDVTFALIHSTPYRLRYLLTSLGGTNPGVLPNAAAATPDLRTDADPAGTGGEARNPLLQLVSQAVANQNIARTIFFTTGKIPADGGYAHCEVRITPRTAGSGGPGVWLVDANEGAAAGSVASTGFGVLVVTPPEQAGQTAILDIKLKDYYKGGNMNESP